VVVGNAENARDTMQRQSRKRTAQSWQSQSLSAGNLEILKSASMALSKPVTRRNLSIIERCEAMEAAITLDRTGSVQLGGKTMREFQDIAAYYQVGKSVVSKLKNMSSAQKQQLRDSAKNQPKSSKRTRDQVRQYFDMRFHSVFIFWCLLFLFSSRLTTIYWRKLCLNGLLSFEQLIFLLQLQ
jgi:hypothetical protein